MGFIGLNYTAWEAHFTPAVEVGWRLGSQYWDKGYATEGARGLIQRAFARPEVRRVVATALIDNRASIRVMEKAGLKRLREFALLGFEQPAVKYGLSRDEYPSEQLPPS